MENFCVQPCSLLNLLRIFVHLCKCAQTDQNKIMTQSFPLLPKFSFFMSVQNVEKLSHKWLCTTEQIFCYLFKMYFEHGIERSTIKLRYVMSSVTQTYRHYFLSKSSGSLRGVVFLRHDTSQTLRALRQIPGNPLRVSHPALHSTSFPR